ncbi:MAG: TetR/AcrR family transcriptional regulator [Nonomuraea sp.]|nr:TetR/AcrR family transcriptional regulator [Nonomuraea sp.]
MTDTERPLRADARRNRERIMAAAAELFARHGREAQMEEIAARSGLGIGTLYRHFPTKSALLTAMVGARFARMAETARAAELIEDPGEAFESLVRGYLEAADGDAAFQLALMGSEQVSWDGLRAEKAAFFDVVTRVIERAAAAGKVRADLTFADFRLLTRGVIASMYFKEGGNPDWRRHLDLVLAGVRP